MTAAQYEGYVVNINNLFNEEYQSVLSRPMPRLNYEIFLDIRPKWGKRNKKQ